jgi:beta-galactosidase
LPARDHPATLDVLVEAVGHVNFGQEVFDPKGLYAPLKLAGQVLVGWQMFKLPLDDPMLARLKFQDATGGNPGPAFWRGHMQLDQLGDTFIDLHFWGKGVIWVNGHCLGRYWDIGPTQTAYLPGCWLRPGDNEIVILDLLGPERPEISGLAEPVLNELHPEKDFLPDRRPPVNLNLASVAPAFTGSFPPGPAAQEIHFSASLPVAGRYFCLQSLNAQDGKPYAAVAELDVLGTDGKSLSHDGWTIAYVDSEERLAEDGSAENAIDGQTASFWHTQWKDASPGHPHELILDLGKTQTVSGFRYVPRQGGDSVAGRIKDYRIYVGDNLISK